MKPINLIFDIKRDMHDYVELMQGYSYSFECEFYDDGIEFDLTGYNMSVDMLLANGDYDFRINSKVVSGNKITFNTDVISDYTGDANLQILLDKNSTYTGSWLVNCNVKPSVLNEVKNTDLVTDLKQTIQEGKDLYDKGGVATKQDIAEVNTKLSQKANNVDVRKKTESIMLNDLHTEVKTAMTGGSVAVVGEDAVGYENIKTNSVFDAHVTTIKANKINEIELNQSINIFDNSLYEGGKTLNVSTGAVEDGTLTFWGVTGFIEVEPNSEYTFNRIDGSTGSQVCFYSQDKMFISGRTYGDSVTKITTPNDKRVAYMQRSCDKWFGDKGVVTVGDTVVTEFIPFFKEVKIPNLKLDGSLIATKSEDNTEHTIVVTNQGEIVAIPNAHLENKDNLKFEITGKSIVEDDILFTSTGTGQTAVINSRGYTKKFKNSGYFNIKKYENDEVRYTFSKVSSDPLINMNGGYYPCDFIIMDEDLNEIKTIRMKESGTVADGYPAENHDYIYINDNHYILLTYHPNIVDNIPNLSGRYKVVNCVIQEVKDDKVVFHWESINDPQFYQLNHYATDYASFPESGETYNDYVHVNSIVIDSRDNNILVSARHCGIFKLKRTTGELMWFFGRKRCDIIGLEANYLPYMQHDARYNYDNSITCFDNSGGVQKEVRVCRYWIDEKTKELTEFREYITPYQKSPYMGSALLIDDELDVFDIAYGGPDYEFAVTEYSFKLNKTFFKIKTNSQTPLYRISRSGDYGKQRS